jgi:methyl coenzyme M reductase alpha subunit
LKATHTRWGWKLFEAPGVEPCFSKRDKAIDYAQNRACFRSGEVRIFDSCGNIERVIPFDDANRKLQCRD